MIVTFYGPSARHFLTSMVIFWAIFSSNSAFCQNIKLPPDSDFIQYSATGNDPCFAKAEYSDNREIQHHDEYFSGKIKNYSTFDYGSRVYIKNTCNSTEVFHSNRYFRYMNMFDWRQNHPVTQVLVDAKEVLIINCDSGCYIADSVKSPVFNYPTKRSTPPTSQPSQAPRYTPVG